MVNPLQSAGGTSGTNVLSYILTFTTQNATSGTKLIAAIAISNNVATTVTSVQDAALNSMTQVGYLDDNVNLVKVALYAMDTPAGDVGIKPAIKVTVSNTADISMVIQEVPGLAVGNTLAAMIDGGALAASSSGAAAATMNSGAYSSTASGEYRIAVFIDNGGPEVIAKPWGTLDPASVNNNSFANCLIAWSDSTGAAEGGASTQWSETSGTQTGWATLLTAFKLAAGPAAVTSTPQRYGQAAPPSPAPWQQRARQGLPPAPYLLENELLGGAGTSQRYQAAAPYAARWQMPQQRNYVSDPLLLGTAELENELLGGQDYRRHRWNHAATQVDRREVPQQRPLVSDPNLLAPAPPLDPTQSAWTSLQAAYLAPAMLTDRREVPQQRAYVSDPSFYPSGAPSDPLLGEADHRWRRYHHAVTMYDRREYPQQRTYLGVDLTTAELENELLGAGDTARHAQAAAFTDRREYPYQPKRDALTPGLLDQALLENELLGGADTARHGLAAVYQDRREMPQQRIIPPDGGQAAIAMTGVGSGTTEAWWGTDTDAFYRAQRILVSDPNLLPPVPLDPTLAARLPRLLALVTPATHYDRRLVPQQRAYLSDPSFYPSGAVTDPLTLAWGAGGGYQHLYRLAADITDRREYFTQRPYVSDPLLLLSALLENELLGGAETGKYYRTPATHAARWWMPQQRTYLGVDLTTAELENELLGAGDTARHWLAACYQDRREVPQQRAYISDPSFYPSGAVTDPLTVAFGAGGPYWHLYNRAADAADRREVPQQRAYVSDPLLLTTAELENELLGGAGTALRYLLPATHADRREVPAQRQFFPLPQLFLDPVQSAWASLWLACNLAATHVDRRLYPQQRLYWPVPLPPPPFTVGTLTSATAAASALTAASTAGGSTGGTLTATTQVTGGPA